MNKPKAQLDLTSLRNRLDSSRGKQYWRSLEELAETDEFLEFVHREFPNNASEWRDPIGRRKFLRLMGASLALAGLTACTRQPAEKIIPYVRAPEEIIPGKPLFFATAMALSGVACGLLVESHMGRPTKIEGNPDHPGSLGAADAFSQASILNLYDPDRSQTLTYLGAIRPYSSFLGALTPALEAQRALGGQGFRVLTETISSPTLAAQMSELKQAFPEMKWHQYEPVGPGNARTGARMAFGEALDPVFDFEKADVILSLDADFLASHPGNVRYIRDFSRRRSVSAGRGSMNRFYQAESAVTNTGAKADHRLPVRPSEVEVLARAVAAMVGVPNAEPVQDLPGGNWVRSVVSDLEAHRGRGLVLAGEHQPPVVHALAFAINHALGNTGETVSFIEPLEPDPPDQIESLQELVRDIDESRVDLLFILGGNPVFTAPADLELGEKLRKVSFTAHLSMYNDETSAFCRWHIPETHFLESWSDSRAFDGTAGIVQPLIAPLYRGRSAHEVVAGLLGQPERSSYEIVREYWAGLWGLVAGAEDFEERWQRAVHDGVISESAPAPKTVSLSSGLPPPGAQSTGAGELEVVFRSDPSIHDGRFANNGWLQELPRPISKLTWDNAAMVSPSTAERFGLSREDLIELDRGGRSITVPVLIDPGHANDCVTVHFGYGRTRAGRVGNEVGSSVWPLRTTDAASIARGVTLRRPGGTRLLAHTQHHHSIEADARRINTLVRTGTIAEYEENPEFVHELGHDPDPETTMYPPFEYPGYAWGMAIDMNACVGCNACVIACQSENNIPVVGKEEVSRGREMHWIRIDRYYKGGLDNPETFFQPLTCMHCENAPCEVVCPVAATVHSAEGLNDMVYNRCVGTRYCSNNCPYKVRRFNFFLYSDFETENLKMQRNPNVTVRSRGVMEKCTYCVQRINEARIESEKEGRRVRDGEIVTACQQTCPAEAIVFGDINDPESRVSKLKAEQRNYGLLTDLNTRPRTTYLAAFKNPNPDLENEA